MARTDAHRPYHVLEVDEPQRFREHHNHLNGVCDLVPGIESAWSRFSGHCYRSYVGKQRLCGCSWCGGSHYRFRERRWWRHKIRQLLSDARKLDDWDDLDVWPRRTMPW
jgi:hypothetical protein